ncbi:MAG: glycoside hydrolase, family 38 [Gemmatimonadetes bacterium]|nr:glycoside hydrolase, family 38 [Gemmatimonadota bacterium]
MTRLVFHLVPHVHWDREWYLPEATLRVRLVGMLDDLIARLTRDGTLAHFLFDGQAALIEDYLRVRPGQAPALAALIRSGRLEVGPWYVLADEQLVSGESLIRNLLVGGRMAERLGRRSGMLYSPDAFGHPGMLPDLAREFGLMHAVLWRGVGDSDSARDAFVWRGPAGGRLFVYHLPPPGYEMGADLPADRITLPAAWQRLREQLIARSSGPHILVFVGADHHWVHRDLPLLRSLIAELEPGNEVRISRADAAVAALSGSARGIPEGAGELRDVSRATWVLQGTHGTRAPLKRRNSEIELALERIAAPLVALAGGDDLAGALAFAWSTLLQNHFHDSICGTVADTVARTMETRFADVEAAGKEIARRAIHRIVAHDPDRARENSPRIRPRLVLWNPAARPRGGVVLARISAFRRDVLVGPPDNRTPRTGSAALPAVLARADERFTLQVLGRRDASERLDADHHYPDLDLVEQAVVALEAPVLPGLGWGMLEPSSDTASSGPAPHAPVTAQGMSLDNGLVRVTLSRHGRLELADHAREERYTDLLELVGGGDRGDTYTWCPVGLERALDPVGPVRQRLVASGPLVGALEASWSVRTGAGTGGKGRVDLRLVVHLFAGSPLVRCVLEVDNWATDHRLRLRLPTDLEGADLVTGAQLGSVHRTEVRPDHERHRLEAPVSTVPAHRFAAAARAGRGLAILAPGFFEVEWRKGDVFATLLRAVGQLSRNDLDTRSGHAAWPEATPLAQCPGRSRVAFALAPLDAAVLASGNALPELWEDAFVPLQALWLRDATDLHLPAGSIELEGEGLVLSTIKRAEEGEGMVIRCWNNSGGRVQGLLRFGEPRASAARSRADEREPRAVPLGNGGRELRFVAEPYAWVTLMVR